MCWLLQSAQLWHLPTFLLYPLLLLAALECFAGYHAWRFLLGFNGALVGLAGGLMCGMLVGVWPLVLLGMLIGALAGGYFFVSLVPLGSTVFAFGSVASFLILLGRLAGFPSAGCFPIALAAGIAAAVAVLLVRRPVMITVAALAGAQQITAAWSAYHLPAGTIPCPDLVTPTEWLLFAALAATGLLIQFATSRQAPPLQNQA